jgi:hypothetical protein
MARYSSVAAASPVPAAVGADREDRDHAQGPAVNLRTSANPASAQSCSIKFVGQLRDAIRAGSFVEGYSPAASVIVPRNCARSCW